MPGNLFFIIKCSQPKSVFHGKFPTSSTTSQTSGVLVGGVCVWNDC